MTKKNDKKELSVVSMTGEEREGVWDELFVKEEGLVLEFDPASNTGKLKSLDDNSVYDIDSHSQLKTKIELRPGDKVLFAPFEGPEGKNIAKIHKILGLSV